MKYRHSIMILAPMISTGFAAYAQEVYENVDRQGVVEFSDQPGPDAKPVDVRPNVVDVAPVKPIQPSAPAPAAGAAEAPSGKAQPGVVERTVPASYRDEQETRREHKIKAERREGAVRQPVHKDAGQATGRKGAIGR